MPSQAKPTTFLGRLGNNLKAGSVFKSEPRSVGHIVSAGVTVGLMGPLLVGSVALTAAAWETCNAFKGILAPVRWLGKLSVGVVGGAAIVGAFAGSLATSLVLMPVNYALSEVILNPALSLIQAARGKTMEAKDYLLDEDKKKLIKKDPSLQEKYFPSDITEQDRRFKQISKTQQQAIIAAISAQNNRDNEDSHSVSSSMSENDDLLDGYKYNPEGDEDNPMRDILMRQQEMLEEQKLIQQLTAAREKMQGQNASVPLSAFNLSRPKTNVGNPKSASLATVESLPDLQKRNLSMKVRHKFLI